MRIQDIQLVNVAGVTHHPMRTPTAAVTISNYDFGRRGTVFYAVGSANPSYKVQQWVIQSSQAVLETVLDQLLELAGNDAYNPVFCEWKDGSPVTTRDGTYIFSNFTPDYSTVTANGVKVTYDLQLKGLKSRARVFGWSGSGLYNSVGDGINYLGVPVGASATATTLARTGAEAGTYAVATGLPASGGIIMPPGLPVFTRRVRVYDRNTGAAAPASWSGATPTGWKEVYGHQHVFAGDLILTNGLVMMVFAVGSAPQVWAYISGAWVNVGALTSSNSTNNGTVVTSQISSLSSERAYITALLADAIGGQAIMEYRLDRAMRHIDFTLQPLLGSMLALFSSTKTLKLGMSEIWVADLTLSDSFPAFGYPFLTRPYMSAMSTDASMTWMPVLGSASYTNIPVGNSTALWLATAATKMQTIRGALGLALPGVTTLKYQIEAESATLVGTGATSVADALASGGNAVQCAGTSTATGEGVSRVPGTDGQGMPTGSTYGVGARVRVGASDAQVCRIETPGTIPTMKLITAATYVAAQRPVNASPVVAATGQITRVLRARYRDVILNDNPLRYYRLGDTTTAAVDLGSGNVAGLYSGGYTQSQTGVLTASGDTDFATLFNGTTGYVVYDPFPLTGATAYSFEGWFKTGSAAGIQTIVSFGNGSATANYAALILNAGVPTYSTFNDDLSSGMAAQNDNAFHHFVGTYDPTISTFGSMYLYVDGILKASRTHTVAPSVASGFNTIGARWITSTRQDYFNGTLDEIALYPATLSASQILSHYNAAKAAGKLYIDEVGFIPLQNADEGAADLYQQWAGDHEISPAVFV